MPQGPALRHRRPVRRHRRPERRRLLRPRCRGLRARRPVPEAPERVRPARREGPCVRRGVRGR
ncbi:MAG: hypothetical protein F4187_03185 [Gemmatimonadetes bacterium]|nr:hypothetical protein [Gemmatimonadota bacterium]